MASPRRTLFPGAIYHITARAIDGRPLFEDDVFRELFLSRLDTVVREHEWICDAYCLMTNHYHLLLRTPNEGLPEGMQHLNTWIAVNYNCHRGRRGHVFEARYRSIPIERQEHLLEAARYVVLNPVRARMKGVATASDYRWSSYRATAGLAARPRFLTTEWILAQLQGPRRYREFVARGAGASTLQALLLT